MRVLQAFIKQSKLMSSQEKLFRMVVILYSLSRKHKQKIKMEMLRAWCLLMKKQHIRTNYLVFFPFFDGVKQGEFNGKYGTLNAAIFFYTNCMLLACLSLA